MRSQTTILAALVLCFVMASGAMGQSKPVIRVLDLSFPANIDSSVFRDTVSETFSLSGRSYSEIVGKVYRTVVDTIFDKDSVSFSLEAKVDDDYDSTWYTIWTAGPLEEDNVGGIQTAINVQMADSSASVWDLFRFNLIFHCNDDSTGDHGATFDWPAEYRARMIFRER